MFKKIAIFIYFFTISLSSLCVPTSLLAAEPVECASGNCSQGLKAAGGVLSGAIGKAGLETNLTVAVSTVIQGILALVGTIFFIMMVYAGILWLSAHGNDTQVVKAKSIITESVLGLAVTMSAYAITFFVTTRLGG